MPSVIVCQMHLLSYAHSNSQPLSLHLNCFLVSLLRRLCGSLFQIVSPHTRKLPQPNQVDRAHEMTITEIQWHYADE